MNECNAIPPGRVDPTRAAIPLLGPFLAAIGACSPAPQPTSSEVPPTPALVYDVRMDSESPLLLKGSLDLSSHPGTGRTVQARGVYFGLEPQVVRPHCGETELPERGPGEWALPDDCRRLEWTIMLEEGRRGVVNASRQASVHFPEGRWWLLSESTSLLRITPAAEGSGSVLRIHLPDPAGHQVGAVAVEPEGGWRIPPAESAPEFYAFGEPVLRQMEMGSARVTYVIDDVARFERLPLAKAHASALSYLSRVFRVPPDLPERDRHLLVVWLGIDEDEGEIGGSAGSRSFLANYVDGDEEDLELNAARGMALLAHEQVHQLQDLVDPPGPPWPVWLGESLAHYYGLKAMARGPFADDVIALVRDYFIDPERPVAVGLPEWGRRHAEGDSTAYPMFYLQGATFWAEVERALLDGDPGGEGWDGLIPELLGSPVPAPGLPKAFIGILEARGGDGMVQVLERYLGGRGPT